MVVGTFFAEHLILIPVVTWVVAVVLKGTFAAFAGFDSKAIIAKALSSGGMPSVHSALVASLTTAIGIKNGTTSDLFALALAFSSIIIYDAINVRFEAGLHAKELNKIRRTGDWAEETFRAFNESLGHHPKEALMGALLGIVVAWVLLASGL